MNTKKDMKQYRYSLACDQTFEDAYCFESSLDENDAQSLAYEASEYYYSQKGDCEVYWPMTMELFKENGSSLGVFEIGRQLEFHF